MIEELRNKLSLEKFKIICFSKYIDIINYKELLSINDNEIILLSFNKKIIIKGNNLVIIKLVSDELLISGVIEEILWINIK